MLENQKKVVRAVGSPTKIRVVYALYEFDKVGFVANFTDLLDAVGGSATTLRFALNDLQKLGFVGLNKRHDRKNRLDIVLTDDGRALYDVLDVISNIGGTHEKNVRWP